MGFLDLFKKRITVVTHSGSFHADDVFAVATLSLIAEMEGKELEIKRTREEKEILESDIAVDVGMKYEPENFRFDHHQKGGAGEHKNDSSGAETKIPYASFGLVWKHFGEKLCGDAEIAKMVEERLVISVDARDNGVTISKPNEAGIFDHRTHDMICNFNPTWQEDQSMIDRQFEKVLNLAKEILLREIAYAKAEIDGEKITKSEIEKQNNPTILVLNQYTDWEKAASKSKNTKFVVYKHRNGNDWCAQSVRDDLENYNSDRAKMPETWRGLRGIELEKASGINGAMFCTNGGWYLTTKSKESAIAMAKKALGQTN